jgi:hypothetical protein
MLDGDGLCPGCSLDSATSWAAARHCYATSLTCWALAQAGVVVAVACVAAVAGAGLAAAGWRPPGHCLLPVPAPAPAAPSTPAPDAQLSVDVRFASWSSPQHCSLIAHIRQCLIRHGTEAGLLARQPARHQPQHVPNSTTIPRPDSPTPAVLGPGRQLHLDLSHDSVHQAGAHTSSCCLAGLGIKWAASAGVLLGEAPRAVCVHPMQRLRQHVVQRAAELSCSVNLHIEFGIVVVGKVPAARPDVILVDVLFMQGYTLMQRIWCCAACHCSAPVHRACQFHLIAAELRSEATSDHNSRSKAPSLLVPGHGTEERASCVEGDCVGYDCPEQIVCLLSSYDLSEAYAQYNT